MTISTGRAIALGVAAGALAVSAAWAASGSSGGDQAAASTTGPARVTACTPHAATDMTIVATNPGAEVITYTLQADWYTSQGDHYLTARLTTDPIAPGKSVTVTAGNPSDDQDYRPGMHCYVKVTETH